MICAFRNKMMIVCGFMLFLFLNACITKESNTNEQKYDTTNIQVYVDSCTKLYQMAIDEIKDGMDKDSVSKRYSDRIVTTHLRFKEAFDSITSDYINKKLTQEGYDSIRKSIVLDSVRQKSNELSRLGINIKLK